MAEHTPVVVWPVLCVNNRAPYGHLHIAVEREPNLRFRQAKSLNIVIKLVITLSEHDSVRCFHDKLELVFLNTTLDITLRLTVFVNGHHGKYLLENHLPRAATDVQRNTCTDVHCTFRFVEGWTLLNLMVV